MSLAQEIPQIMDHVKAQEYNIEHNNKLFRINEGDLLTYIEKDLEEQFSPDSYKQILQRIAPINVLQRINDKLSKIYQQSVSRTIVDGTAKDETLLNYYCEEMQINKYMNLANEFFNLFKTCLLQPFLYEGEPKLRVIPSNMFTVYSNNRDIPTEPTHIITCAGMHKGVALYYVYSKDEVLVVNANKEIQYDYMREYGIDGVNIYGVLPFVYINRSLTLLNPIPDTDVLKMTKIIPILLSDLNFAVMYQAFSIMYGIDVNDENLRMSPNSFWSFKSDPGTGQKPEVGVIKPQVDISAVIELVTTEFVMWLETKGIKPGDVQSIGTANAASGIAKIIDEMDTFEDRKSQITYFTDAEHELWELIIEKMHPVWVATKQINIKQDFTIGADVRVVFNDPKPFISRGALVDELQKEVKAGFLPKKMAIQRLNPDMSEKEIDEMIAQIDGEKTIEMPEVNDIEDETTMMGEMNGDEDARGDIQNT